VFGHLDDRSPPEGDLDAVLRRAGRSVREHRVARRRRLLAAFALFAVVAVVAGVSATDGPRHVGSRQISYLFRQHDDPLPVGSAVPTTALARLVFVSADDGFALAVHHQHVLLASSVDGGTSWEVVDPELPVAGTATGGTRGELEFSTAERGYLWDGAELGAPTSPLWVTTDGGRTWQRAPVGPVVFDVSAIGGSVWAVVGSCPLAGGPTSSAAAASASSTPSAPSGRAGSSCPLSLEVSADGGTQWQQAASDVPAASVVTSLPGTAVELARISPTRAYVVSDPSGTGATPASPTIAFTSDGGRSWVTVASPCQATVDAGLEMAASSTDDLWLFCAGHGADGDQAKALYRSLDAGASWTLTASTPGVTGAEASRGTGVGAIPLPGSPPSPGALPLPGYLAPWSIGHQNLAVASATTAWLLPAWSGSFLVTEDGGTIWEPVPAAGLSGTGGNPAAVDLTFNSATVGWFCELGVGLWRTTDGTDWYKIGS